MSDLLEKFTFVNVINSFMNYKKSFDESQRLPISKNFNNLPFNNFSWQPDTYTC